MLATTSQLLPVNVGTDHQLLIKIRLHDPDERSGAEAPSVSHGVKRSWQSSYQQSSMQNPISQKQWNSIRPDQMVNSVYHVSLYPSLRVRGGCNRRAQVRAPAGHVDPPLERMVGWTAKSNSEFLLCFYDCAGTSSNPGLDLLNSIMQYLSMRGGLSNALRPISRASYHKNL